MAELANGSPTTDPAHVPLTAWLAFQASSARQLTEVLGARACTYYFSACPSSKAVKRGTGSVQDATLTSLWCPKTVDNTRSTHELADSSQDNKLTTSAHKHGLAAARHTETRVKDVANGDGHLAVERTTLVPAARPLITSFACGEQACAAREQNHIQIKTSSAGLQCRLHMLASAVRRTV